MKNCIIFSLYYTGNNRECVEYYFNILKNRFNDFDIYLGINGTVDNWLIQNMGSGWVYEEVPKELVIDSDASGYLRGLFKLKQSGKKYYTVWFMHSKHASKIFDSNHDYIKMLENDYFSNIPNVLKYFNDENVGIVGHEPSIFGVGEHIESSLRIKKDLNLPCNPIGFFYCGTYYVIRGEIINNFLNKVSDGFFTKNIFDLCGFDRFFFEGVFKSIPEMMGYYPCILRESEYKNGIFIQQKAIEKRDDWSKSKNNYKPTVWV